jgi:preprotein translocase subunit SecG
MNPPFSPPVLAFLTIGSVTYFGLWLFAFGSLLARTDLDPIERLTWVLVMLFAPFSLIFYIALAPDQPARKIDRNSPDVSGTPWEKIPPNTGRAG